MDKAGNAYSYRAIVRQSCDEEVCDVALAVAVASFDAAQQVDYYEEQELPEYADQQEWVETIESGLFKEYKVPKMRTKRVQVGTRVNKIPVFKQKKFTAGDMEAIKNYLEHKVMKEVLHLAPTHTMAPRAQ